ncbi:MAG: (d)CMP kinase [Puniceicoccales bacterium]|jgi:cytidylate kinase|nr:(d)CMP kinase [Puniceicoccales bacterium]
MKDFIIVAIDGVAASGKSTAAARLAEKFSYLNVNTGNHYRALTVLLIKNGSGYGDPLDDFLDSCLVDAKINGNFLDMVINGMAAEQLDIRSNLINANVSAFAQNESLRKFLKKYQRGLVKVAQQNGFPGMVMEGRDIGSVVFPEADFKFFLTANREVRLNRCANDHRTDDICLRDNVDSSLISLIKDAVEINTTAQNVDQVVAFMAKIILSDKPTANARGLGSMFPH